jgi:hypothetical protein
MGDPDPIYNDLCFPPSRGTARNDMGAHGGPCACCWAGPCEGPMVGPLAPQATCAGMNVTFCITATGAEPLSYQWRYHGTNAANPPMDLMGEINPCLTLSNVDSNRIGYYSVRVSNAFGGEDSNPALLLVSAVCVSLDLYAGLSITGQVGHAYCIQYTTDLSTLPGPVWTSLTNFTLTTSPDYFYLDPQPANRPRRFYQVIEGTCP